MILYINIYLDKIFENRTYKLNDKPFFLTLGGKYKGKKIKKKNEKKRKVKNRFQINKLFLYISSNSF